MKSINVINSNDGESAGFDLARLTNSKTTVDICSNTLRTYFKDGLPCYRRGKAVFFSKAELARFIRNPASFQKPGRRSTI